MSTTRTLSVAAAVGIVLGMALGPAACVPKNWGGGASDGGGGGGAPSGAPAEALTFSPEPIGFALTSAGTMVEQELRIENHSASGRWIEIERVVVVRDADGVFGVVPQTFPTSIGPGGELIVRLTFRPKGARSYGAEVEIASDDLNPLKTIVVTGTGRAAGIVVSPGTLAFGNVMQNTGILSESIVIQNTATVPHVVDAITLARNDGGVYSLTSMPDLPLTVMPGEMHEFGIALTTALSGYFEAIVSVSSDDPSYPTSNVRATATVDPEPVGPPPPPPGPTVEGEFQVNRSTLREQQRPFLAALPSPSKENAVAIAMFFDRSNTSDYTGEPKNQWSVSPISPDGALPRLKDTKIVKTSEGSVYCGIDADPVSGTYAVAGRYEVVNDASAKTIWMSTVGSGGADYGGLMVLDVEKIPSGQTISTLDIAVDPSGQRFIVWRLSGTSTSLGALPPGMYGRVVTRAGDKVTPVFLLSIAPHTNMRNPRVAWNGQKFIAIWEDLNTRAIEGRFFSNAGAALSDDFTVSPLATVATTAQVAANATSGDFVVVYRAGAEIEAQVVHADGALGPRATINGTTAGTQELPAVAVDPSSGECAFAWTGPDAGGRGIFARRFTAALTPAGDEMAVNTTTAGEQIEPAVTWCPAIRRWLVAWTAQDEDLTGVRARFLPAQ